VKLLVLAAVLASTTAGAQIVWQQTEATLQVHPAQVSADAVFAFTNAGPESVSFKDIKISCGCLTVRPPAPSYAPGEKGQLVITLNLRNRLGPQRKHVWIETDDGKHTDLTVATDIPQLYVVEPKLLNWEPGDEAQQKTAHLRNPHALPIRLLSISSSHEGLPAELKTIREGFEYEVVVHRNPGTVNARSVVRIDTEPPPELKESKSINLYVFAQ